VQKRNWENALAPNPRERASYMRENFVPLEEAGALEIWDGAAEPWPGFELIPADGHTRGQQLVRHSPGHRGTRFAAALYWASERPSANSHHCSGSQSPPTNASTLAP